MKITFDELKRKRPDVVDLLARSAFELTELMAEAPSKEEDQYKLFVRWFGELIFKMASL